MTMIRKMLILNNSYLVYIFNQSNCIKYYFSISVDKTEALHKQTSLQSSSSGASSSSSSIGVSSASSSSVSSLVKSSAAIYSYFMSGLFSYLSILMAGGRHHSTSLLMILVPISLINISLITSSLGLLPRTQYYSQETTSKNTYIFDLLS